jgi:LysR family hydrogen peroxide-inducible transcriptional activator
MTITQLEYIIAVDIHRSFAEAARHCHVTQPTLSIQIKKLEEELGTVVFDRSRKPVRPTELGRSIIDQARTTVQAADRIQEMVSAEKEEISGTLRIGIIPTLSPYLLPLFITELVRRYPELEVTVEELMSEQIIDGLKEDRLDAGLLVTPLQDKDLVERPLFYELFVVYMASDHPLHREHRIDHTVLDTRELWLLREGHCFRNQVLNICGQEQQNGVLNLHFEGGSLETLRRIVDQHFGYTLLPELATLDMSADQYQRIKHFKDPQPVREVSLVRRRNFVKTRLMDCLQDVILERIPGILKNPDRGRRVDWMEGEH